MDKTILTIIIKLLVAILVIILLWWVMLYSKVSNIDNNVNKYTFVTEEEWGNGVIYP